MVLCGFGMKVIISPEKASLNSMICSGSCLRCHLLGLSFWALPITIGDFLRGWVLLSTDLLILVHDVFVHQRIKWLRGARFRYFKAMRQTHHLHHGVHTKEGAEAFGFLFVPKRYLNKYGRD